MSRVWLTTERIRLREFTGDDADLIVALDADPEVVKYVGGKHTSPEEARDRMIPYCLNWHARDPDRGFWIAETSTGEFLGWFHFRPPHEPEEPGVELGYRLLKAAWGQGYATEVSAAILAKGFAEPRVERICAKTLSVNRASQRVMQKIGMTYDRTFMEQRVDPPAEAVWYGVSRAEYERFIKGP